MSTSLPSHRFDIAEPIPGYRTIERIGAGGYGEVWKAEAPGGIAKAIKVVYGYRDDARASRELAALNRIKEVSHPFVLSLERIEMIDGHLVIVTELATSNLKQLFEQYRGRGMPGIPRAELLGHLGDAADALDYLCREHGLQHLDVKPENLLLVGGRIKVGDFGLVKDLQDVNCSMISGLTPIYAGPELFDGRPSVHSDQYSLAIVYQEMLTGSPPFAGRTTAQLAAQHLHSRPRLDRLPASDQATVGRALSKNPDERFPSCRELIDSLLEVTPNYRSPARRTLADRGAYRAPSPSMAGPVKTEMLSPEECLAEPPDVLSSPSPPVPVLEPAPPVRDLAGLDLVPDDVQYRPTIFIGLGGLAARTLQSLYSRLSNQFGDMHQVPAFQVLLFDTDCETLKAISESDAEPSFGDQAAVAIPLRQPAEYRCESSHHLQWLSRRWIYNIPRSLQTQGLRPLGRLALVDHCARVAERIAKAIQAAVAPEAIQQSAETSGLPLRGGPPRVLVVSSITGGTGGGMALDVAYLVRKTLRELGLSDEGLCGVLAYCQGGNRQGRDLAAANAYAFLTELQHYSDPRHAYPGDPACGLPAFPAEDPPFSQTYLVELGEDLEERGFLAAAGKLAKYLYFSTVTPAAAFFDKCRQGPSADSAASAAETHVRTFGLSQLGFSYDDIPAPAVDELARLLVMRWRGAPADDPEQRPNSLADPGSLLEAQAVEGLSKEELRTEVASRLDAMGLDVRRIVDELYATATRAMGDNPDSYLINVLSRVVSSYQANPSLHHNSLAEAIVESLDTLLRVQDMQDGNRTCVESVLEKRLAEIAAGHGAALGEWILGLVGTPNHRVERAQRAADYVSERLRALGREAGESIQARRRELASLKQSLLADDSRGKNFLRARGFLWRRRLMPARCLSEYFHSGMEELMLNGVCRMLGLVLAHVATANDRLRNLAADLNRMAEGFQPLPASACPGAGFVTPGADAALRVAAETLSSRKGELVAEIERDLEEDLRLVVASEELDARALVPRIRRASRAAILRAFKKVALHEIAASDCQAGGPIFSLATGLEAARPGFSQCGGARRLLIVTPADSSSEPVLAQLANLVPQPPTVVTGAADGVLLCYEGEGLSLRRVAAAVVSGRLPSVEIASRLHTRIDVAWES